MGVSSRKEVPRSRANRGNPDNIFSSANVSNLGSTDWQPFCLQRRPFVTAITAWNERLDDIEPVGRNQP